MIVLCVDIETKDPYIGRKYGAGWPYLYHDYQNCDYKVLGIAYSKVKINALGERETLVEPKYETDFNKIPEIFEGADIVIGHNCQYDLGGIMALGFEEIVNKFYGKTVDTIIMAKLENSSRMAYSLDALSKALLNKNKTHDELVYETWEKGIYPYTKKEEKEQEKDVLWERGPIKPTIASRVKNWTYSNLDVVQEKSYETVAKYAKMDVELTLDLFFELNKRMKSLYKKPVNKTLSFCKLIHVCIDYTKRGVRVDLDKVDRAISEMQPKITENLSKIYEMAGEEFNINATASLAAVFQRMGLKVKKTEKGNLSVTKDMLEEESHPIAQLIRTAKEYTKIINDYMEKTKAICQFTMKKDEDGLRKYGRVHPNYGPMNARTGRFSCQGPNLQQVPKRNKVLGVWCRGIFVPEEGETWYAIDFSNQEGRLQVHFAAKWKVDGHQDLVKAFNIDPNYDLHQEVADSIGVSRTQAKTINLGLSYGMGGGKLCQGLGLPTEEIWSHKQKKFFDIAGHEGKKIIEDYHTLYPFLKNLTDLAKTTSETKGYVTTLGGRKNKTDVAIVNGKRIEFFHKAFNQLIQGSAFDQTAICMVKAYEAGISCMVTVHDEICLSGCETQAIALKRIMENAIPLHVPVVAEIESGPNWWGE